MPHYHGSRASLLFLVILFAAVCAYGVFEARSILFGPTITILSPSQNSVVSDPYLVIRGTGLHVVTLKMNGRDVSLTENGSFEEPIALLPGYNKVVFSGTDRLGWTVEQSLNIVYDKTDPTASATGTLP